MALAPFIPGVTSPRGWVAVAEDKLFEAGYTEALRDTAMTRQLKAGLPAEIVTNMQLCTTRGWAQTTSYLQRHHPALETRRKLIGRLEQQLYKDGEQLHVHFSSIKAQFTEGMGKARVAELSLDERQELVELLQATLPSTLRMDPAYAYNFQQWATDGDHDGQADYAEEWERRRVIESARNPQGLAFAATVFPAVAADSALTYAADGRRGPRACYLCKGPHYARECPESAAFQQFLASRH